MFYFYFCCLQNASEPINEYMLSESAAWRCVCVVMMMSGCDKHSVCIGTGCVCLLFPDSFSNIHQIESRGDLPSSGPRLPSSTDTEKKIYRCSGVKASAKQIHIRKTTFTRIKQWNRLIVNSCKQITQCRQVDSRHCREKHCFYALVTFDICLFGFS